MTAFKPNRKMATLAVLWLLISPSLASAQLVWRISVKFFVDMNGNLPGGAITPGAVQNQIASANQILAAMGRGYQFQLTEIVNLPVSLSGQWFNVDVKAQKSNLDSAAKADPATYSYRNNAINVYINGHNSSGQCSFPWDSEDIIFIGQGAATTTIFHESGHYLGLCHTQGCSCGDCGTCDDPDNDEISDTAPDRACWNQDDIANNAFNMNYSSLNDPQKAYVDNSFFNMMSYHSPRNRLTSDQMDRATDYSNGARANITNGRTRFVDYVNTCLSPVGSSSCSFIIVNGTPVFIGGPFPTVGAGVSTAAPGDIVLIRSGHYNESMLIAKALTLRASRGNAVIGQP